MSLSDYTYTWIAMTFVITVVRPEFCEDKPTGYYCHPHDDTRFYRCHLGYTYDFACPAGLKFNMAAMLCTWEGDCALSGVQNQTEDEADDDVEIPKQLADQQSMTPKRKISNYWERKRNYIKPTFSTRRPPHVLKTARRNFYKNVKDIPWRRKTSKGCSSACGAATCRCASTEVPGGFSHAETPQMVMLTFDDYVNHESYLIYKRLLERRRLNNNGCPIRVTFYLSGSGTDYQLVRPLYNIGSEIAVHTLSHRFPASWWSHATYQEYSHEILGMKEKIVTEANIPREAVRGFRVPFLQIGGDNMYSVLRDNDFTYDSSMFSVATDVPVWPFTLHEPPTTSLCAIGPRPTASFPGLWELPIQRWYGVDGVMCSMSDSCNTGDGQATEGFLRKNFERYYGTNRAPFGIYIHNSWLRKGQHLEALENFLDYLVSLDDVWIVTPKQVIDWMKQPTSARDVNNFAPWGCSHATKNAKLDDV